MCRLKAIILLMMIFLIGMGCAHSPVKPHDPFKIDAQQFYSRVKTIALVPVRLPGDVPECDAVKAQLEASIEERLRQAGFNVIPSKAYRETEEKKAREGGGYYDIKTGALDQEKFKSVEDQTRKEMHATLRTDAFLYGAVRVVPARFMGGTVHWHGTQESISKTGKQSEANRTGVVGALSLGIWIDDHEEKDLYAHWGGIQLLSKIEDKGKILASLRFSPIPEEEILSDKARNENAVGIALAPLLYQMQLQESPESSKAPTPKKP